MPSQILSTTRPSPLRLWGFVCVALGGLALGLGALSTWATVSFPGTDVEGMFKGVDTWEGLVVLLAALVALVGAVAVRLLASPRARRAVAVAILVLSLGAIAVALSTALRAEARYGGGEGLDRIAANVAAQLNLPVDEVRAQLEQEYEAQRRVDIGAGVWLAVAGGTLAAVGAVLTLAWISRSPRGNVAPSPADSGGAAEDDAPSEGTAPA
jgi:hypothetical protein